MEMSTVLLFSQGIVGNKPYPGTHRSSCSKGFSLYPWLLIQHVWTTLLVQRCVSSQILPPWNSFCIALCLLTKGLHSCNVAQFLHRAHFYNFPSAGKPETERTSISGTPAISSGSSSIEHYTGVWLDHHKETGFWLWLFSGLELYITL